MNFQLFNFQTLRRLFIVASIIALLTGLIDWNLFWKTFPYFTYVVYFPWIFIRSIAPPEDVFSVYLDENLRYVKDQEMRANLLDRRYNPEASFVISFVFAVLFWFVVIFCLRFLFILMVKMLRKIKN